MVEEPESGGLFQGSELPRLLVLVAIAVGGWMAVWWYLMKGPGDPGEAEPVVTGRPPAVRPDRSPEFETVTDKTMLGFRDTAAYEKLLKEAAKSTPAGLAARARRDVFYAHLWGRPGDFRGVPVHLRGTARRVLYYESSLSRTGWLYEAWVFTPDSQGNPFVCVSEDAPKGLPIGPNLSELVSFDGYFLKLMAYPAGDVRRAAPLLVGKMTWAAPAKPLTSDRSAYWLAGGIAVMFAFSLFRWISQLRRSFAPKPLPSFLRDRPTEEIAPEALSDYLANLPEGDEGDEPGRARP